MPSALKKLTQQSRKLLSAIVHPDYRAALRRAGVAAAIEHESVLRHLGCATVVDIGANRGQFALVTRHVLPEVKIISFEPLTAPAQKFRAVFDEDSRVTLHQIAVGPSCGEATIHVAAEDDSSSLLPITALQTSLHPKTYETRTETIRVAPLETLVEPADIEPPALLKIDVQGYELLTLQGCETLLKLFKYVYVECSFVELYEGQALASEVIEYLQCRHFRLCGVYNASYGLNGQAIQADFLFLVNR
jgi:FkbM family methyltransferase